MFDVDSTVFKCDLLSITPNIRVNIDESKKENIANASTMVVKTIMVQRTLNPKYFREIITKKLIPVYRIRDRYGLLQPIGGTTYHMVPNIPCFIKYSDTQFYCEYRGNDLKVADAKEVKTYIEKHISPDGTCNDFLNELNGIFERAEGYYDDAAKKNNCSNATEVKSLIKRMRKGSNLK